MQGRSDNAGTEAGAVGGTGTGAVVQALARLRARARLLLVARRVSVVAAALVAAAMLGAVLDYLVLMPRWLRVFMWLGGAGALVWAVRTFVAPALAFRPALHDVALRIENSAEGERAGLRGVLASGVELGSRPGDSAATRWMSAQVVERALASFSGIRPGALLTPAPTRWRVLMLALLLMGVSVLGVREPALTATGALRVLAPWTDAAWPKRTQLADATNIRVHALGATLPLRAALLRTDMDPGQTSVSVKYRIVDEGVPGPVRRLFLTAQPRFVQVVTEAGASPTSAELFERLIEPTGMGVGPQTGAPPGERMRELEYWFETADDTTAAARIRLVRPPEVVAARAEVSPPEYAGAASGAGMVSGPVDMGPGGDDRAVLAPVLAGSEVRLTVRFNKAVPGPAGVDAAALENYAMRTFGSAALAGAIDMPPGWAGHGGDKAAGEGESEERGTADSVTLRFVAERSLRLPVIVSDSFGLTNTEEAVYTVDVVQDRAPTVSVIDPREDESVLASAEVGVQGEARDDAGLRWVALERQWARPPPGSIGAAPEPMAASVEFAREDAGGEGPLQARAGRMLDLRTADERLMPGDEVWITAVAQDTYLVDGRTHEPVRSAVRKLRIVSADQFVEQMRGQLAQVRETAKVLDAEQGSVSRAQAEGGATPEVRSRQAGLTDRLAAQVRAVQDLIDRAGRNNLPDEALGALLAEARRMAASAAGASGSAAEALAGPEESAPPERVEEAQRQQDRVRDELGRLIDLLDRGQDSWLARRDLQRLLEDQKALAAQTRQATESMIGKSSDALSPQERATLDAIAQRQRELAERAEQAIADLADKGRELEEKDAVQADAMQQAADRGQRDDVPSTMQQAAEEAQENRGQQAQESQQEAIESLEQMAQDLDNAAKNRDEALRRVLASLVDTLKGLVRRQGEEIAALGRAAGAFEGLDRGMIRLNQNTLATAGETREKGLAELVPIAELLDRAVESQAGAIRGLRSTPVDADAAEKGEQASLLRLREALAEAEKQKEEADRRENDRKRRELKAAYTAILESQVSLRDETATYVGKALTRKQSQGVRRLGERQAQVRKELSDLRQATDGLADAGVFVFAHQRLDDVTGAAADRLGDGIADGVAARMQASAVRTLQNILEALDDAKPPEEDEFRENEAGEDGGGGGGGGGSAPPEGLIPEMAELLLLRGIQQEAAELTRGLDEGAGVEPGEIESLGRLQRDLAEEGQRLIDKLKSQGGSAATPEPDAEPGPEPGAAGDSEPEGEGAER